MEPEYPINIAVEGATDAAVIRHLLTHINLPLGPVFVKRGKKQLLEDLSNYNQSARYRPWLVVVDLDQDADCAPDFTHDKLPNPARGMRLRVAVRAIESWLLADTSRLAKFLNIQENKIPPVPDSEPKPKATMINLARQSRNKAIREDMVPREGSGGKVGPGYVGRIIEFAAQWQPEVAATHSDSLRRCITALETLRNWKPK